MNDKPDQSFDSIADKFERNIYGSTKGKLRQAVLLAQLKAFLSPQPMQIVDVGGGTGVMAKALWELGHDLILADISEQAIELARDKFEPSHRIRFVHCDLQQLSIPEPADLVICHAVLEWLQYPKQAIEKLLELVKPGGYLSLSFFNKDAFLFGNMLYGNFDYVQQGMQQPNQVKLNPNRPLSPKVVLGWLADLPVNTEFVGGVRCFHDYLYDRHQQHRDYAKLEKLELSYSSQEPYLWLGKYFHVVLKKY